MTEVRQSPSGKFVAVLSPGETAIVPDGTFLGNILFWDDVLGQWVSPASAAPIAGDSLVWDGFAWVPTPGAVATVSSVFGRMGAVVAVAGDYAASEVTNDSLVFGATVADALDALEALIGGLPSGGLPVDVDKSAASAGVALTLSRSDHKHDASTAAPPAGAVAVGNASAEGAATTLARSDHTHAVAAGVPVTTATANAAGAAATFARSDHVHQTAGSTSVPNQSAVTGATTTDALNALNTAIGAASNSVRMLGAADLDEPNSSNWAITAIAVISADSLNPMIVNRNFDDTIEQGVGFDVPIPAGAVNMTIRFISRAQTAPGVAAAVQPRLYRKQIPDNIAVGAWSAALSLALLSIPTNTNWQYDTETISLATLGLTAGLNAFFELTRQVARNWNLYAVSVSFS
jgi:hypothetical protein